MLLRERMAAFIESITRQQYYKPVSIQPYLLQVGVDTSVFVAVFLQVGVNVAVFHLPLEFFAEYKVRLDVVITKSRSECYLRSGVITVSLLFITLPLL